MNIQEQREAAIAQVRKAIADRSLATRHSNKAIHLFLEFLRTQMPSVAEKYAAKPETIEVAIANNFSNIPDDTDASVMPVRGGQPFGGRRRRK